MLRSKDIGHIRSTIRKLLPETCTISRSPVTISDSGGAVAGDAQDLGEFACRKLPIAAQVREEAGATPETMDVEFHFEPTADVREGDEIIQSTERFCVTGVIDRWPHVIKIARTRRLS